MKERETMDYLKKYEQWITGDCFDEATKEELKAIAGNEKEIKERFYQDLAFGTGGLRGIIGAGTNRINEYTIGKATQGLANYILEHGEGAKKKGVAIAYDSRHFSKEFAERTALVLAGNGIKAYVYPSLRPTPMLSFAVRQLGCIAGVVITASHNPPEYNGYKVYWEDGGQVPYPRDGEIIKRVNGVEKYTDIKTMALEEAKQIGLYQTIGKEVDDAFLEQVAHQSLNQDCIRSLGKDFAVVYTPIHGSGNIPVQKALEKVGFQNVYVVPEQALPDPEFTTVGYPNPEDPKVFTLAIALAKKVNADVIVGTDPDCDRVGAVVKNNDGEYVVLSGNMTGALLTEYILSQRKAKGLLPKNGAVVKTIVSTEMVRPMCDAYGVTLFDVLTGFKYIGEKIKEFETEHSYEYLFGFEESYGCLAGTYARDKDAVVATLLICEMTAYYKAKGMTLFDGLAELYEKYGYYQETIHSITLKGLDGIEKIQTIMKTFRENPPKTLLGIENEWVRDYKEKTFHNLLTGEQVENGLPSSDVLHYTLKDGTWLCIRPSGTEPKLKFYYGVKGETLLMAEEKVASLKREVEELVAKI